MTEKKIAKPVEILLVEDNPLDVELALHALRDNHLENRIQVVRDGSEALDYIYCQGEFADRDANDVPNVILLDLKLPKVSGLEVLERLKSDPNTKNIPIVVLTSSDQDRDIEKCYEYGVNSYIVKPVDFEQFTDAIRQIKYYWVLLNKPINNS
jgi:CheY-like chemotaxis protein